MNSAFDKLSPEEQRIIHAKVKDLLGKSEAFANLPSEDRQSVTTRLLDVVAFLAEPKTGGLTLGQALAGEGGQGGPGGSPGADAFGKGVRAGAQAYRELTSAVDFPNFVAGLIDGVFNSIVTASIRQMDAYSKLLENVAKSVDQFAKDNFTLNQGRDYLASRFPSSLKLDVNGGSPRLVPTPQGEESNLAEVKQGLSLEKGVDLSEPESEAELARQAQLEMARLRQKQLATMVLLGIHRIVVTDGLINAKVVIDVQASDKATSTRTASSFDSKQDSSYKQDSGGWFSSEFTAEAAGHRTVVKSASDETSESKAEAKAKLTGEVRVNFKSETFPLDRVASQTQIDSVAERAKP